MQDLGLLGADEWGSDHGHVIIAPKAEARLSKLLGKNPMDFVDEIYKNLRRRASPIRTNRNAGLRRP
jgi:hypothetical protein